MISAALAICSFAILAVFMFRRLRIAAYSPRVSAVLVALASLQLGCALSASALHALALGLMLFVVAETMVEYARIRSARGVIRLGLSLAALQVVSPTGVIMSALLAPALTVSHTPAASRQKSAGLLMLFLFLPVASAFALWYVASQFHFDIAVHMAGALDHLVRPRIFDPHDPRRSGLINAAAMAIAAGPIWLTAARFRSAGPVAIATSALVVAVAVAALLHRSYSFGAFVPSLGGLCLLAIAESERGPHRTLWAISMSTMAAAVSWIVLMAQA